MIINHIEKLFVTNDAGTILKELEVEHPAAKMLVMASGMQDKQIGDGTNTVIIFAAALLEHASELMSMVINLHYFGYSDSCIWICIYLKMHMFTLINLENKFTAGLFAILVYAVRFFSYAWCPQL